MLQVIRNETTLEVDLVQPIDESMLDEIAGGVYGRDTPW
jgi:hypothetical protein